MKYFNRFLYLSLLCGVCLTACDLQPKIASIPDSVGAFISNRYPALLADPETEPEIYNSAVTDYGVYASPELYGSDNVEDYVLYASIDDYVLVPSDEDESEQNEESDETTELDELEDVLSPSHPSEPDEEIDDYIVVPLYGGENIADVEKTKSEKVTDSKQDKKTDEKQAEKKDVKQPTETKDFVIVAKGDTLYSLARSNNTTVKDLAKINNLKEPYKLSIGQKLRIKQEATKETPKTETLKQTTDAKTTKQSVIEKTPKKQEIKKSSAKETKPNNNKRVDLQEITVAKGDTLYSISRKYEIPVNDLAVMNKLSVPFTLSVGQKLKVPKLNSVQTRSVKEAKEEKKQPAKTNKSKTEITKKESAKVSNAKKQDVKKSKEEAKKKITKTTPKTKSNTQSHLVAPRSSSKFSWPVRGKILSQYGAKNSGLFNDGINISAQRGTIVKAAENGVVAYAGNELKGMGNLIIIQHSDGWMTVYAHLDSMVVRRGTKVVVGQQIGKIGQTGKVDKPQLHFEIRRGRKAYNPIQYLNK